MPPARNSRSKGARAGIIQAIRTPLGFYVLSLLIVEATLGLVLTVSKLNEAHVWFGFYVAVGLFLLVFLAVTILVIWKPKNLLFGAEEHSNPELEKTALRDQIEDLIYANVKPECLQKSEKRGN
jgi:heme A synthase